MAENTIDHPGALFSRPERILTNDLIDRLDDLICDARALEMAISGSASLDRDESRALIRQSGKLGDAIKAVHDAIDAHHQAEIASRQTS